MATWRECQMCDKPLTLPGFETALLGKAERCGLGPVYVYSAAAVINILMQRDSMDLDEALEYYEFNILGAYHGEGTPLFMDDMWEGDELSEEIAE
jgi:hypothetical protein